MLFHSALDNLTMDFEFEGVRVVSGEDKERENPITVSRKLYSYTVPDFCLWPISMTCTL